MGLGHRLSSGQVHRRLNLPRLYQALVRAPVIACLNLKLVLCIERCRLFRFAFVRPDRSSLWCTIATLVGGVPADESLKDCITYNLKVFECVVVCLLCGNSHTSQRAPMELVSWPYKNSPRHDMCSCLLLHCSAAPASIPFISIIPYIRFHLTVPLRFSWLKWTADRFGRPDEAGK